MMHAGVLSAGRLDLSELPHAQDPRWSVVSRSTLDATKNTHHTSPSHLQGPVGKTDPHADSEGRRRKVRKGTRSCWECKRRKIKCEFLLASDPVCVKCQRRGTSCIGQAYHYDPSRRFDGKGARVDERIVRVEALVNQLVKKVGNPSIVADAAVTQGLLAFSTSNISTDATAMTADTLGQRESGSPAGPQYRDDRPAPSSSTTNPGDAGRKATTTDPDATRKRHWPDNNGQVRQMVGLSQLFCSVSTSDTRACVQSNTQTTYISSTAKLVPGTRCSCTDPIHFQCNRYA